MGVIIEMSKWVGSVALIIGLVLMLIVYPIISQISTVSAKWEKGVLGFGIALLILGIIGLAIVGLNFVLYPQETCKNEMRK